MVKIRLLVALLASMFLTVEAYAAACNDGVDNDGDGQVDYPADPGCFAGTDDGEQNPDAGPIVGGLYMPSLEDERDTYRAWGWSWDASDEPNHPSAPGYTVSGPDIHYDTEGDDLWSYLMMYIRTGQRGYLDRARAWARFFKEDYATCRGPDQRDTLCWDRDNMGLDHLYGWGLIAWYEYTGDTDALAAAETVAGMVDSYWVRRGGGSWPAPGVYVTLRRVGRHLNLLSRLATVTGDPRWIALRDYLIEVSLQASNWDAARGMYWVRESTTNNNAFAGAYDQGMRIQTTFQISVMAEGLYRAYLSTNRQDIRDRIIAMARFVDQYGMEPTYQYATSWFGLNINTETPWYNYTSGGSPSFWDPVYTHGLSNLLVMASRFTGDARLYNRAKYFFDRGSKALSSSRDGSSGTPRVTAGPDEVDHFVDSEFSSSSRDFYLRRNKGELQYTYLLFDPASRGQGDFIAPASPRGLDAQ